MSKRNRAHLAATFRRIGGCYLLAGWLFVPAAAQQFQQPDTAGNETVEFAVTRQERLPVPSDERLAAARTNAKDTYAIRMRSAKSRADRAGLAQLMLQDAATQSAAPEVLYARLELARDTASAAGAFQVAMEAVDRIGARFEIKTDVVKASLLWKMTRGSVSTEERSQAARCALPLVNSALRESNAKVAGELVKFAIDQSRRARDVDLTRQAVALGKRVEAVAAAETQAETYRVRLQQNPGDGAANLWMGNYLCLVQRNWSLGVTYWALGSDSALATLAQRELDEPTETAELVALGDAYYRHASKLADLQNESMLQRAGHWYRHALRGPVARVDRERIEKRLEEIPEDEFASEQELIAYTGFDTRGDTARTVLTRQYGGTKESEAAVARALEWITAHQSPDGSWNFDHRGGECRARCGNAGNATNGTMGSTALALLPLLGAGNTHQSGVYKQNVAAGLQYLIKNMQVSPHGGNLRGQNVDDGVGAYSHAMATMALCEVYGMTHDRDLLTATRAALAYTMYAQDPTGGGWRYRPRQPGDTSVTGWYLTALYLGQRSGVATVPPPVWSRSAGFLNSVQSDGGAAYGYTDAGSGSATSAAGLLCRMYQGWKRDDDALQRGAERLGNMGPSTTNLYYNYYATQVLFQHTRGQGEIWETWNTQLRDSLIQRQSLDDHAAGSWYIGSQGTDKGGRLYCTSLATLCLQVYYRYPVFNE